ncbi:hypothetical protein A3N99_02650 [Mycobacteroides abscessus]|uniref:hypothetical protein n=1 Tax=Mycobacteroides abscessus TaxID=36809 RepID=UPI00078E2EA7|nr:hypothetical protein [Mycobacteroides abscessus]AMU39212.1 hypothetical protein A3N99_02650 [Mycobacteroides abscessus]
MAETPKPTRELVARMRDAADTLQDVSRIYFDESRAEGASNIDWRPVNLRSVADSWDAEIDAEELVTEQLTQCIAGFLTQSTQYERVARERATPLAYLIHANFDVKPKGTKA